MPDTNLVTQSWRMAEGKPVRSLVPEARPALLDQLRKPFRARHYIRGTEQQ